MNIKTSFIKFIASASLALAILSACEKDDELIPVSQFHLTAILPEVMEGSASPEGLSVELINTVNGNVVTGSTDADGVYTGTVEEGVYTVKVTGERSYSTAIGDELFEQTVTVNALKENFSITGEEVVLEVNLFISLSGTDWVFKEIYFTGSKTPEGSSYRYDKFFEIYNNTDKTLYADGLSICEADHVSTSAVNMWESIIDEAFVTAVIYTVPGSGTDYPVLPGHSIVIADIARDHRTENSNSFDLSGADFEWYDDNKLDVDIPEVPNLIRYFSYSATIWTPHSSGYKAYVVFKAQNGMAEYLENNAIEKQNANGSVSTRYKVPNELILDAVELGTPSGFSSKALSSALDISYTHCGDGDDVRFGKSIRRKVQSVESDGRIVLMDTNNSAVDFLSTVDPKPGVIGE